VLPLFIYDDFLLINIYIATLCYFAITTIADITKRNVFDLMNDIIYLMDDDFGVYYETNYMNETKTNYE
jgi:hypothetical protein